MTTIEIRNVGPIKEVPEITLNSVNVFMGPQSSGKSTIAKIISYCTWVEKDVATRQSLTDYNGTTRFKDVLESFHKIKGYFRTDSYIRYRSDVAEIVWENKSCTINLIKRRSYRRSKIAYIPSERNMVILPEVEAVAFNKTNIRSFLFDWFNARKMYPRKKYKRSLPILNLGVNYFSSDEEDHIQGSEGDLRYDVLLSNASSGLQSLTPLLVMIEYLTNWVYKEDSVSFIEQAEQNKVILDELTLQGSTLFEKPTLSSIDNPQMSIDNPQMMKLIEDLRKHLFKTNNSQFIIEEPEMNLFPEAQRDLTYYLLNKCVKKGRKGNRLTITTHSHYILYALNNCMMAGLVYDKMDEGLKERLKCGPFRIAPSYISIYEIREGVIKQIQQTDGLIEDNYFDQQMGELMEDFYLMLNYYS